MDCNSISAPIAFKQSIKSIISGSIAILLISVSPLAKVAAIIIFSVAPTEIIGSSILAPFNPAFASHFIYPCSKLNSPPSLASASTWIFTGLAPIAQPPGIETEASLFLASSGPKTKILARIFLTKSYSAKALLLSLYVNCI